jgi:hypothetical protein
MSIALIRDRLATYDCKSEIEEEQAVRKLRKNLFLPHWAAPNFSRKRRSREGHAFGFCMVLTGFRSISILP